MYASTHRSLQEKEEFYIDLQKTLDGVARDDVLLLLGDFNARVGIRIVVRGIQEGLIGME